MMMKIITFDYMYCKTCLYG